MLSFIVHKESYVVDVVCVDMAICAASLFVMALYQGFDARFVASIIFVMNLQRIILVVCMVVA